MKTSTKWIIGIIIALVLFVLLITYSMDIYLWMMSKLTTILIWLVIFIAGYLLGRFSGHRKSEEE
ncbi:MAG: hypothetical protein RRY73_00735 [Alistipes sp.]